MDTKQDTEKTQDHASLAGFLCTASTRHHAVHESSTAAGVAARRCVRIRRVVDAAHIAAPARPPAERVATAQSRCMCVRARVSRVCGREGGARVWSKIRSTRRTHHHPRTLAIIQTQARLVALEVLLAGEVRGSQAVEQELASHVGMAELTQRDASWARLLVGPSQPQFQPQPQH